MIFDKTFTQINLLKQIWKFVRRGKLRNFWLLATAILAIKSQTSGILHSVLSKYIYMLKTIYFYPKQKNLWNYSTTRQRSTVRNSDEKNWAVNMNLWKMITPVKHSPLCPPCPCPFHYVWHLCPPSSCPPSQNIHHWKMFTPEKYSPLKTSHSWKLFTPEKIHP